MDCDIEWNGIRFNPRVTNEDLLVKLQDFETTSDDVLLVGYPRTGTMWFQDILYRVHHPDDQQSEKQFIQNRVLQLDIFGAGKTAEQHFHDLQNMSKPRLYKTHLTPKCLSEKILPSGCKVVLLSRNPKDTLVSFYQFYLGFPFSVPYQGSWNEFFDLLVSKKKLLWGDWFDFVSQWWQVLQSRPNTLVVMYEDMKERPVEEITRLAKFCNMDLGDETVEDIAKKTEFSKSKERDSLGLTKAGYEVDISGMMRKGVVGDWKGYFNQDQNEYVDERLKVLESETGLRFKM